MRMNVKSATIGILTGLVAWGLSSATHAQSPGGDRPAYVAVQKKKAAPRRAPTRIRVQPLFRHRHDSTPYPRTDNLGFPGRNAVRQCVARLVPDYRPSGTVITQRMQCWWERG